MKKIINIANICAKVLEIQGWENVASIFLSRALSAASVFASRPYSRPTQKFTIYILSTAGPIDTIRFHLNQAGRVTSTAAQTQSPIVNATIPTAPPI